MNGIKIAFVGFGQQASCHHARYLVDQRHNEVALTGIYDILPEDLEGCKRSLDSLGLKIDPLIILGSDPHDPQNMSSVQELLRADPLPDAVVVSTPHAKHFQQILLCLEHGIHVLVDKPLALTCLEAQKLVQLAEEKDLVLVVASQRRYEPAYTHVRELVSRGEIGDILSVNALLSQPHDMMIKGWRADPALSHGGVGGDMGWHTLDFLCHLLGSDIERVHANLWYRSDEMVERAAAINARWASGKSAVVSINHLAPAMSVYECMYIWGTRGIIVVKRIKQLRDTMQPSVDVQKLDGGVYLQPDFSTKPARRWAPTEAFIDEILVRRGGAKSLKKTRVLSSGAESIATVALIEGMYQSARTGSVVGF